MPDTGSLPEREGGSFLKDLCNGVFEGGGVRGIGHVGAACAMERAGYTFSDLAGSSAGAIVASLLAAGYSAEEVRQEMLKTDYLKFKQKDILDHLGTLGKTLSIIFNYGIYNAAYFEEWLTKLLARKRKYVFGDLEASRQKALCRLRVTATDLTDRRLLVLPDDLAFFGMRPLEYPIARAVRMSMSIPFFYEPFRLTDCCGRVHYMVDGGMISNYPIWIMDDGKTMPAIPSFGFKFSEGPPEHPDQRQKQKKINIVEYIKMMVSTALDAYDNRFEADTRGDFERCIMIPVTIRLNDGTEKKVSSTDFEITGEESEALFHNGEKAAQRFLEGWNFEAWKQKYRAGYPAARPFSSVGSRVPNACNLPLKSEGL